MNDEEYRQKEDYVHSGWTVEKRRKHIYRLLIEENKEYLGGDVLMIGCNAGSTLQLLNELGVSAVGMDINEEAAALAIERGCEVFVGNATHPPFEDYTFNAIVAFDIIEHIAAEDMPAMVKEWKRILKTFGRVVAFSPRTGLINPSKSALDKHHLQFFENQFDFTRDWNNDFDILRKDHETRQNPGLKGRHDALLMVLRCKK